MDEMYWVGDLSQGQKDCESNLRKQKKLESNVLLTATWIK